MSTGYWTSLDPMELILEAWDQFDDMQVCLTSPEPAHLIMAPRGPSGLVVGWADNIEWVGNDMQKLDEEVEWENED